MHPLIESSREHIAILCRRHRVSRLDVFGSALSEDFDPGFSDFDAVVEFEPIPGDSSLHRYFNLKQELERLLKRSVDLVELKAMPETRLKRIIEHSKVPLYAAPG